MPVPMELSRIFIREMTDVQIIELKEIDGDRSFPIVVGLPEAFAIERRLKGAKVPRPQTHDLLASVITTLGGRLERILINDLSGGTFFATLFVDQAGRELEIDARPSDAIALGVSEGVPIFVAEHVLEEIQADAAAEILPELPDDDDDEPEVELDWD